MIIALINLLGFKKDFTWRMSENVLVSKGYVNVLDRTYKDII